MKPIFECDLDLSAVDWNGDPYINTVIAADAITDALEDAAKEAHAAGVKRLLVVVTVEEVKG